MTISTERLQEMLAACAGAMMPIAECSVSSIRYVFDRRAGGWRKMATTAAHIANCDPDTIRELITEVLSSRSAGAEGREAVVEECAQVADDHAAAWGNAMSSPARVIADAIRSLKENSHGA